MSHSTPHDALFKAVLSDPTNAAEHLRSALPSTVLRHLDLETLEVDQESLVDKQLADRHGDLLFHVRLGAQEGLLHLLFEHRSTPEPDMPLRLLGYILRIWERWRARRGPSKPLPPILPLVLYHGQDRWRAPLRFADVVFQDPALRADIGRYCPDFEYLLQDLSRYEDHDLQGTALAQMMLLLLKHVRNPDLPRLLPRWTQVMLGVLSSTGLIGVRLVLQYLVEATDTVSAPDLVGWLREITSAGAQEEVMTLAQQWLNEGIEKGIEKGRRQQLLRLVALRFGDVPEAAKARLGAGGQAELDRWEERLLFAASLEEMLEQ